MRSPVATRVGAISRADPGVTEHVVGARRLLDPPRVELSEHPHRSDRLVDVPALVGVHHQHTVRAQLATNQRGTARVGLDVATDLHLHVCESRRQRLADETFDLGVGVAEPAGGRRVGRVSVANDLGDAFIATRAHPAQQLERLVGRQDISDVAKVDGGNELFGFEIDEELPQRLALPLGPEVPDGVDDRGGRQVDHTLLGSEPAELAVGGESAPEPAHVGDDVLERPSDDQVLQRSCRRDDDLGPPPVGERQPMTLQVIVGVRAQNDVGSRVVGAGVQSV